jgi:4-amino-4-deoxy-L-arabinose transferase-like glycosyltransferase
MPLASQAKNPLRAPAAIQRIRIHPRHPGAGEICEDRKGVPEADNLKAQDNGMIMRPWSSPGCWIALLFVGIGYQFLQKPGLHFDASYELACFYPCSNAVSKVSVFGYEIPVMILPYLGTLKAILYQPQLSFFEVTALALRLPTLLVGAGSVWLFFLVLDRIGGRLAAVTGALLLATDASFVLATSVDFGPIALLHFLMLSGVLLLMRFGRTRSLGCLALGFFVFGLALWYKALFVWVLVGLGLAAILTFPKRLLELFSPGRAATAVLSFCLGASPLIFYNVISGGATLHLEAVMSAPTPLRQKLAVLRKTIDGSAMFGFLTDESYTGSVRQPSGNVERISVSLNAFVGDVKASWMLFAFIASCCFTPWLWFTRCRRSIAFSVVFLVTTWAQMAAIRNTGAALHHAILLWPFPHFLIAIAAKQLSRALGRHLSLLPAAGVCLIVGSNLLLLNQYHSHLVTRGTTVVWTEAVYPLFDYLDSMNGSQFVAVDWGYSTTLCLLSDGKLPIRDFSMNLQSSRPAVGTIRSLAADPRTVFIQHAAGCEQFQGVNARVSRIAQEAGFATQVLRVICDRYNRPRFEVLRFISSGERRSGSDAGSRSQ